MELNYTLITLALGIGLDSLLGDPYWMPHPIRAFGHAIAFLEKRCNQGSHRRLKGGLCWLLLVSSVIGGLVGLQLALAAFPLLLALINGILFYFALSNRCLIEETLKVENKLQHSDLDDARAQLSMIVGRDTSQLNASQIRAATVETSSENLSDGVIAPLFFFALGGIPLMMGYKMVNTLDSMVGYKNERYREFGFFSAKLDDLFNLIPARLTSLMMIIVSASWRACGFVLRYGRAHSSPNAGYPEAALAGILDCRLGGPNSYFGSIVDKPYIGHHARELQHSDVLRSCWINVKVSALGYAILILLALSY